MASVNRMKTYFAFIHKDPDSVYGVVFPDVPGCFSAGDTYEQAIANAGQALRLHYDVSTDEDVAFPEPRGLDELLADAEVRDEMSNAPLVAVALDLTGDPDVEIRVVLDANFVQAIDEAARKRGLTRSAFFIDAALSRISA